MEAQTLTWPRVATEPPPPPECSLEELEAQARERGYAAGLAAGEAAGRQNMEEELKQALLPVRALHDGLQRHRLTLEEEECEVLARLIIAAFETLLTVELRLDGGQLAGVLGEAIAQLPHADGLEIHAHPQVMKELSRHFPEARFVADEASPPAVLDVRASGGRWRADAVSEFSRLVETTFLRVEDASGDR